MNIIEVLKKHQAWLNGEDGGSRANLHCANLHCANLRGANLRGADLTGADLTGADLRDANLTGADLPGADLRDADLFNADLRNANLRDANLFNANLRDANLFNADLFNADLRGAYLRGATGNMREIKTMHVETYPIAYTAEILQIGCEQHPIADWWGFDDERISQMDATSALKWWRKWIFVIKQTVELSPATHTRT